MHAYICTSNNCHVPQNNAIVISEHEHWHVICCHAHVLVQVQASARTSNRTEVASVGRKNIPHSQGHVISKCRREHVPHMKGPEAACVGTKCHFTVRDM